jgi:putative membrane protein
MLDLHLAFAHHILMLILFGILAGELVLVRTPLTEQTLRRLAPLDLWYGIVAVAIVIVGFSRAIFAAKGWGYYSANLFFWAKMATFIAISLLSIWPTVAFIRWRTGLRLGKLPDASQIAPVRLVLCTEAMLFALVPIFAALMARGYGM